MQLMKRTPDGFFRIIIESDELDRLDDDAPIPISSIEQLIAELYFAAHELQTLIAEPDEHEQPN
jgi:hypothetical protein